MPASRELARKVGIFLHIGTLASAEVTAARAKIRLLQHGQRFEMIGLMTQPLHAMRGSL